MKCFCRVHINGVADVILKCVEWETGSWSHWTDWSDHNYNSDDNRVLVILVEFLLKTKVTILYDTCFNVIHDYLQRTHSFACVCIEFSMFVCIPMGHSRTRKKKEKKKN